MQPEDRIARGPRDAPHVARVANEDVNLAVQIVVQIGVETRPHARRPVVALSEAIEIEWADRPCVLVNRLSGVDLGLSGLAIIPIFPIERLEQRIVLHPELVGDSALSRS